MFLWPPEESLEALSPETEFQGTVVGFSDSGAEACVFAVVEVVKRQNLIVRVQDLEQT